jgi:hypothetical protein
MSPDPVRGWTARPLALGVGLLTGIVMGGAAVVGAIGEDPAAEVTEALRALGPPGGLWGRIAVEEESPAGAWTPLVGIDVGLYPATPSLIAELERIRQSARTSGAQFESAIGRVQAALAAHQSRIDRQMAPSPDESILVAEPPLLPPRPAGKPAGSSSVQPRGSAPPRFSEETSPPRSPDKSRRSGADTKSGTGGEARLEPNRPWHEKKTDSAGLFVFDAVPAGDWLVVATHVAPYAAEKLRSEPKARLPSRGGRGGARYLPRTAGPAKEVELWVMRVRVVAEQRIGLELTDRARWLVGPLRGGP